MANPKTPKNKTPKKPRTLGLLDLITIVAQETFATKRIRSVNIIDTVAGPMVVIPKTDRDTRRPCSFIVKRRENGESVKCNEDHGIHYHTRKAAGMGGKRHGSGINQRTYAQACEGNSSPK